MKDREADDDSHSFNLPFSEKVLRFGTWSYISLVALLAIASLPQPWKGYIAIATFAAGMLYLARRTDSESNAEVASDFDDKDDDDYPGLIEPVRNLGLHDHMPELGYDNDVVFRSLMLRNKLKPEDFR